MQLFIFRGGDFCGEVALGDLNGFAVLGGIDEPGHLGKDTEHQELAYSGEDGAVDDAHRWKQEAPYDEQDANC